VDIPHGFLNKSFPLHLFMTLERSTIVEKLHLTKAKHPNPPGEEVETTWTMY
jgi:hypothetical protein